MLPRKFFFFMIHSCFLIVIFITADSTRVKLKQLSGLPDSHYINANWVSGVAPKTEKAYIATQGPLENTVEDFWR